MKRLSVGVDVSKKTLDVAYWAQDENESVFVGNSPITTRDSRPYNRRWKNEVKPLEPL